MRYRLGLGVAVGVLVAVTVAAVVWVTFLNTRAAIIKLTHDRVRELLVQTGARVQGHMLAAVPAVELSRMLARDSLLPIDRAALARHFLLVLRANPTFSWVSYSDEEGSFTGAYRTLDGTVRISESTMRGGRGQQTIFKEVALMDESLLRMKGSLRSFAYYVPTDLVRAMLASGQEATLQGHTRELTVYFSDIAGFTSMAELMSPDELVRAMSSYLDEMTRVIGTHGGTVDKFTGDAIMAFWGAPAESADHAARACETAVLCQRKLSDIRASGETPWAKGLHARIGIATGLALVGNIGSPQRFNYTVMGDTVNLASRLEGLNKLYGTSVLVSEPTYRGAHDRVVGRPVDIVQVKGRQHGVKVYELLGLATDDDQESRDRAGLGERGLDAYLARDFEAGARHFEEMLRLRAHDPAAALLLERCREFIAAPPPADWTGVHVATQK